MEIDSPAMNGFRGSNQGGNSYERPLSTSPERNPRRFDNTRQSISPTRRGNGASGMGGGSGRESAENSGTTIYVTGISIKATDGDLRDVFEKYGKVTKCQIMNDPHTQESRGFGFVSMADTNHTEDALSNLQGFELHGKAITVEKARRQRPRTPTPGKYYGKADRRDQRRSDDYGRPDFDRGPPNDYGRYSHRYESRGYSPRDMYERQPRDFERNYYDRPPPMYDSRGGGGGFDRYPPRGGGPPMGGSSGFGGHHERFDRRGGGGGGYGGPPMNRGYERSGPPQDSYGMPPRGMGGFDRPPGRGGRGGGGDRGSAGGSAGGWGR